MSAVPLPTQHATAGFRARTTLDETPNLGAEVSFLVKGKVVGHGEEVMNDGHIRKYAKVKVNSVSPTE